MRSFDRNVGPSTAAGLGHCLGIPAELFGRVVILDSQKRWSLCVDVKYTLEPWSPASESESMSASKSCMKGGGGVFLQASKATSAHSQHFYWISVVYPDKMIEKQKMLFRFSNTSSFFSLWTQRCVFIKCPVITISKQNICYVFFSCK